MSAWRLLVALDLDFRSRLGVDQRLVEEADHLVEQVAAFVTLQCAEHLGQVNIVVGHRSIPFVSCMDTSRTTPVARLHDGPTDLHHFRGRQHGRLNRMSALDNPLHLSKRLADFGK